MGKLGIWELLVILAIVLLIFGPKALPKLGESLGKTIGNFKKGLEDDDEDKEKDKNKKDAAEARDGED
ncbi:MAG: twin-arginine translocase TatA/TatE family subunit [Oscillospiraceae bacterium]|nr:twin-arginine translocase TatA/TatE family subunit [Oscillospiraceae bacterium]